MAPSVCSRFITKAISGLCGSRKLYTGQCDLDDEVSDFDVWSAKLSKAQMQEIAQWYPSLYDAFQVAGERWPLQTTALIRIREDIVTALRKYLRVLRLQDDVSNDGVPFSFGFTLEKLTAHTVDEAGKQTFATQNPMELLRKAVFCQLD